MVGSQRSYARHRGVTNRAVQVWLERGVIEATADGKVDFDAADLALAANGTCAKNGNASGHRNGTLVQEQARFIVAKRRLAELELARRRGELVELETVKRTAFAEARRARDLLLSIPDRVIPTLRLPDDAARREAHGVLDGEIRRALLELGRELRSGKAS